MFQALFRPSPDMYGELGRLQGYLDSVLRPMERSSIRAPSGAHFPILNIGATADAIEIMALAPGIDPAALQLTVDRGLLIIAGERANPLPPPGQESNVYAQERFAGAFRRVVSLPDDADPGKIDASYRDGILRVTVARRASARPRRIDVN